MSIFVGMLESGINAMNERKHLEAGVFTGCILWPTDPVARCSAAVVPALQHCSQLLHPAAAFSCCSKPCYDAAVSNASRTFGMAASMFCSFNNRAANNVPFFGWYIRNLLLQSRCLVSAVGAAAAGPSCSLQSAAFSSTPQQLGQAGPRRRTASSTQQPWSLVPAITASRYLGQRCEAWSQVPVFPSTLWFISTSPVTLKCSSQQTFAFITKPLLTLVTFISFKTRVGEHQIHLDLIDCSCEFLQKPIWVTTNFCSPLFLFSSMLDVMWRFCGSFSAGFYSFSKIGSRTEHGRHKKLHCEHKRTTTWGESFLVEVVTGSSVPNPWNKKFGCRHWCR